MCLLLRNRSTDDIKFHRQVIASQQSTPAVGKTKPTVGCVSNNVLWELVIPFYSALIGPQLECYAWFQAAPYKRDTHNLVKVQ